MPRSSTRCDIQYLAAQSALDAQVAYCLPLHVEVPAAARAWLRFQLGGKRVTPVADRSSRKGATREAGPVGHNIAFTREGLVRFGLAADGLGDAESAWGGAQQRVRFGGSGAVQGAEPGMGSVQLDPLAVHPDTIVHVLWLLWGRDPERVERDLARQMRRAERGGMRMIERPVALSPDGDSPSARTRRMNGILAPRVRRRVPITVPAAHDPDHILPAARRRRRLLARRDESRRDVGANGTMWRAPQGVLGDEERVFLPGLTALAYLAAETPGVPDTRVSGPAHPSTSTSAAPTTSATTTVHRGSSRSTTASRTRRPSDHRAPEPVAAGRGSAADPGA